MDIQISIIELTERIFLAGLCGIAIGYERSTRLKVAGIKTHLIVAIASALFMVVSKYGFSEFIIDNKIYYSPDRIAAQVVSGISFIGAGTIIVRHQNVNGLTTAAGVWGAAAIGLAIGAGMYSIGLVVTGIIIIAEFILTEHFMQKYFIRRVSFKIDIVANYNNEVIEDLTNILKKHKVDDTSVEILRIGAQDYHFTLIGKISPRTNQNIIIEELYSHQHVNEVKTI